MTLKTPGGIFSQIAMDELKTEPLYRLGVAAERERCAAKAEALLSDHDPKLGEWVAAAIRKGE
jgi:hypothetical protein